MNERVKFEWLNGVVNFLSFRFSFVKWIFFFFFFDLKLKGVFNYCNQKEWKNFYYFDLFIYLFNHFDIVISTFNS